MVEAVVKAVDVGESTVPACPLTIADPTLNEANHPAIIGIDAIAEGEVLYLHLMLARHDSSNDVLVLADGGKGRIVLDPAQRLGYTALDHRLPPMVRASGATNTPGPSLYPTTTVYRYFLYLSIIY